MTNWLGTVCLCSLVVFVPGCDSSEQPKPDVVVAPTQPELHESIELEEPAPRSFDRDDSIDAAEKLLRDGKTKQAIAELLRVLTADPTDAEVLFRLARIQASSGDLSAAVELLDSIPEDHPGAGLPALGQAADWYMELEQFDEAEIRYQKVVARADGFAPAHRQLAYLYNRQGRRHEAAVHLRSLCELGDIQEDELHALLVLSHAIFDDPHKPSSKKRPYFPIGPAANARMLYTASRYAEAIEALDESVLAGKAVPSVQAFYGLLAVETQDEERFQWWLARADDPVQQFAEYWAAIGAHLLSERRFDEAIRALAEALNRDPTDIASMRRINQALMALGRDDEAERWIDRYVAQRDATLASNAIGESAGAAIDSYDTVADGLDQLHRPLEAAMWRLIKALHQQAPRDKIESLNQKRAAILGTETAFPDESQRLCGLDRSRYSMPTLDIPKKGDTSLPSLHDAPTESYPMPTFRDVASSVGLNHTYQIATTKQPFRFALYQSLGGGAAVLDYDLDGQCDVYLAQGGCDPPTLQGDQSNSLFQNTAGRFTEVTHPAGVAEYRYSIGVSAGDWNQDGFDDLLVANIGNKVLLTNNGDGTFTRHEFDSDPEFGVLTSSVAIADVSGDAIPDIVALHYVEDKSMVDRPDVDDQGQVLTISPASFNAGVDRIAINDGRGGMSVRKVSEAKGTPSTGLGVVVANWDENPGNEIFVGNDIRPNHLWSRDGDSGLWNDTAVLKGCAYGHGGMATASMGIAVADFDGNGKRDIHIANFYLEPVSLFMNRGTAFEDRCVQYKLHRDSSNVLGFGCQAIDYNNDGRPDIAVTNGNIEKAPGEPLEQSPQFFINQGKQFQLTDVNDSSGYWQGEYLGRVMARLDFNSDGKQDLLITHLSAPSALMVNETETDNHWLTVQLIGVESERNAISAEVQVFAGDKIWTNWIVGGDGYLCRNEPTVSFGLGSKKVIDKVVVTWPSGKEQTYTELLIDRRYLLIEGEPQSFDLLLN